VRISIVVAVISLFTVAPASLAQGSASSVLSRLEKEILARISQRALAAGGFSFGASEFDLRFPRVGAEPEEIVGPSIHASEALAVGSARIEPLDSIASRDEKFHRAQYELRLEDRAGNCLVIHQDVRIDSVFTRGRRISERCQPLYMAEVVRRARRIARLPLSAGRLDDHWSVALAATGTADVYFDSVVITTSSIAMRASYPIPETVPVRVDSISAGVAIGDRSWSVVRQSPATRVDTTLRKGGEWRRSVRRFVIPVDSTFDIRKSWPMLQVHVGVPVTTDNPSGLAWTYAHAPKVFFAGLPQMELPSIWRR
jgi:hypothetical protein